MQKYQFSQAKTSPTGRQSLTSKQKMDILNAIEKKLFTNKEAAIHFKVTYQQILNYRKKGT